MKVGYTKLRYCINETSLLYEKTLKQSMVDNKIDDKEVAELKKIYNHYLDKRKEIMKNTIFTAEDLFGDIKSKDPISPKKIKKLINF